ncbi:MAG: glucosamine-6-phosphate deaminase [Ruminococcaceae bacterium]|nr:glucosamine-6-phosphate deaminase [Oscillospiraceae bacterium]
MKVIKVKNYEELSVMAASIIGAQVINKPQCVLGLATGSTPIGTYEKLAEAYNNGILDFSEVKSINLDEYCGLSGDNNQSYRYFMNENLFNKVNIDKENTFVPDGTASDSEKECERYEALCASLGYADLQLLGIGHNGHIGFNEPDSAFAAVTHCVKLQESTINANSRLFEKKEDVPTSAFTMGIGTILKAKKILLVGGADKKDIIEKAIYGDVTPEVPASALQLHKDVTVIYVAE